MHPVLVSLAILLLIVSLKRPVTYVLFVSGARLAVEWLPLTERWAARVCQGLFYDEQALATSGVHEEIYRRFAAQGIEIPFPVQRVVQSAGAEAAARGGTTS